MTTLPTIVGTLLITILSLLGQAGAPVDLQATLDAAQPGSVVQIPAGVYAGNFVVDVPVHLLGVDGPNGERAALDGQQHGTVLTINAAGTIVENLVIRAGGNVIDKEDGGIVVNKAADTQILNNRLEDVLYGIRGIESNRLLVRGNYITGKELDVARRGDGLRIWQSEDCMVENNTLERGRDAIFWFSDGTTIRNNTFHDSRYGIHMMYTDGMQVLDNDLRGNSVGAYLMYSSDVLIRGNTFRNNRGPSGYGVALKDMDIVTVTGNYFFDNRVGLFFDNSPSRVDITQAIERNVLAYNDVGVLMMPAVKRNILVGNTFMDNIEQVGVKGGGSNPGDELGDNSWDGNFWSDYVGYDTADLVNGAENDPTNTQADGIGDLPYRSDRLFENLADRYPALQVFYFSPAEQAVNLAAKAFPVIKPKPKLTDSLPRMAPILPDAVPFTPEPDGRLGWLAAGLLLAAAGLLGSQFRFRLPGATGPTSQPVPTLATPAAALGPGPAPAPTLAAVPVPTTGDSPFAIHHSKDAPMITVKQLTKTYPRPGRSWWSDDTITAVDDLSFELAEGGALALWGVNGAGKTTVLKCLLGLLRCQGELWLNGFDLSKDGRAARRFLGYVPQELSFHNDLSVAESCRFYAKLKDVSLDRIPVVLGQVGLTGQERKAVGALSGGMKQRLALALALLGDPPVLLLDEPTSNLDAATRDEFVALLNDLRRTGKTLLFTSHHREEVEALAEHVLILQDGRIVAQGTPANVLSGRTAIAPVSTERVGVGDPSPKAPATNFGWDASPTPESAD